MATIDLSAGKQNTVCQSIWNERRALGLYLKCVKDGHMLVQCPYSLVGNARRRQLTVTKAEIEIVEEFDEEKPAEN